MVIGYWKLKHWILGFGFIEFVSNLTVRIISPKEEVFKGEAASVSSTNSAGDFDILPEHAKFITLVEKKPIILRSANLPDGRQEFKFDLSIFHVHNNQVDIYVNPADYGLK